MPAAKPVKTSDCPECGARLSNAVCTACALDFLTTPSVVPTVAAKDAQLDMEFGRYLLRRKLASGGMGVVYVAEDRQLKRKVALKMIRGSTFANDADRARFTVESEAVAGLDHPNIIPIYEIGMIEEQPFFTMKLIGGRNLAESLRDQPSTRRVARWLGQIAEAVQHAHRRGVLHRDLKPGNILIDEDDNAWLMDFGLAKLQDQDSGLTQSSDHLGTPNYMSPELVNGGAGDVSTASDVWSLGVILWEALCGEAPFRGAGTAEIMRRIAEAEPSRPPGQVDRDLLTLALRCMEKNPASRVATAGEVAQELDRWARGEPLQVRRITPAERLWKWVRRKPALAALYLALAFGSVGSFVLWRQAEEAVDSLRSTNDQLGQALAISTSTKLAMEARVQVEEDPTLALLLVVEAVEQTERRLGGVLAEAADSLYSVLQQVGGRDVSPLGIPDVPPSDGYFSHGFSQRLPPQFSEDGRQMLAIAHAVDAGRGIEAAIFDLDLAAGSKRIRSWTLWDQAEHHSDFCWLAERDALVTVGDGGEVRLWDTSAVEAGGELLGTLTRDGKKPMDAYLAGKADGKLVRGIAIFDSDDGHDAGYVRFSVDLESAQLVKNPLQSGDAFFGKQTAYGISDDLAWLVSAAPDKSLLTKLAPDGSLVESAVIEREGRVHATFDPTGSYLVVDTDRRTLAVYDLRSGSVGAAFRSLRRFDGIGDTNYVAVAPSGKLMAVGLNSAELKVLHLDGEGPTRTLRLPSGFPLGVSFSPDEKYLGVSGVDRVVRVWPIDQLEKSPAPLEFRGMSMPGLAVYFPPGGRSIVAEGIGSNFRCWDLGGSSGGAQPRALGRQEGKILDLAVSPSGRWFASGIGGGVGFLDVETGDRLDLKPHPPFTTGVAFSPDESWLATTGLDGFVRVWEVGALERALDQGGAIPDPLHEFDISHDRLEYPRKVVFHPRGTLYVSSGDGMLYEWDLTADKPEATRVDYHVHTLSYQLPDVNVSPDGKWLAVARHAWDEEPLPGHTQVGNMVLLYDVSQPGAPVPFAELPANFIDVTNLDFSPDSRWLAAGGGGDGATVWDLHAGAIIESRRTSPAAAQRLAGVSFSPDGRRIALAGSDGRIQLWDWRSNTAAWTIATGQWIETVDWASNGTLVSGGFSGKIDVWETDLARLKELAREVAGRELSAADRGRFRIQAGE